MKHRTNEPLDSASRSSLTTVLNRVRPTVVVRRRVVDVAQDTQAAAKAHIGGAPSGAEDDEDNGPPSSVNVARALASLRAHEINRLEELLSADDEDEEQRAAAAAEAARPPPVAKVKVGEAIAIAELAHRMDVSTQELVTALVTRGFFSVTVKTVLPRETARAAATMFGREVEETDEVVLEAKVKAKASPRTHAALRPKTATRAAPKTTPKSKPASASASAKKKQRRAGPR